MGIICCICVGCDWLGNIYIVYIVGYVATDITTADISAGYITGIICSIGKITAYIIAGGDITTAVYSRTAWSYTIRISYTSIITLTLTIKPIIINTATTPTRTYIPILNIQYVYCSLARIQQKYPCITRQRTSLMSLDHFR